MSIQNEMMNLKARFVAFGQGISLEQVEEGFYLYRNGEQLGYDFDEAWSADDVIDYCHKIEQGRGSGIYLV